MNKVNCVLLVDDDEDDNFFHERAIAKSGYADTVQKVQDGQEALEYLQHATGQTGPSPTPAVILLDINMPRMNGYEFLDAYRQLAPELKAEICVIMLTTSNNPKDIERIERDDSVADFLLKPLTANMFTELIDRHYPS